VYPIFFKRRLQFHLAIFALSVGTPAILVPQFGLTEGRFALVFAALFSGGFFYLVWFDEFFRIWSRKQKKRIAKTVALRGLQVGFIGAPFLGYDVSYAAIFHSVYSYQHLVRSVGGILFSVAMLATSIGLLLDWRDLPGEVDLAAHQALLRMREAGFQLDDSQLWIGIDPKVSSTGYSYPAGDESVILVKPCTVYAPDGRLLLTLAHEMCHIYLFHTKHPSHSSGVVEEAYDPIVKRFSKKWQRRVLRTAIDYPGEVFTEDLALKTSEGAKEEWAKEILEYFGSKAATRRAFAFGEKRRMWRDALLVLRNSYFAAVMDRQQLPDPTGAIPKARDRLLSSLSPTASQAFQDFYSVFLKLRFEMTPDELKKILEEYLSKFVALAEDTDSQVAV
jgi:hypothetical protein